MRLLPVLPALALCVAVIPSVWADKKLDEAVAKAEAQLVKGKEDEAVKILQKAVSQAPRDPEAPLALARLMTRLGKLDEAGKALTKAGELAAGAPATVKARVLAARSTFALRAGTARDALSLAQQAVDAEAGADSLAALARAQARLVLPAARDTAERAARPARTPPPRTLARGDSLSAARLTKQAETAYRRAAELDLVSHPP